VPSESLPNWCISFFILCFLKLGLPAAPALSLHTPSPHPYVCFSLALCLFWNLPCLSNLLALAHTVFSCLRPWHSLFVPT
jgi:hypothetical protein